MIEVGGLIIEPCENQSVCLTDFASVYCSKVVTELLPSKVELKSMAEKTSPVKH